MVGRVPVLDRRPPGNLDWPAADYWADVTQAKLSRRQGRAVREVTATNHLAHAPELAALVESGAARWCLEVRGTQTFYVETFLAEERSNEVGAVFPDDAVRVSTLKALPGLVAVRDCELQPGGLHPLWRRHGSINVPRGTWLARAQHVDLQAGLASIVRFVGEESVGPNRMRLRFVNDGLPHWVAEINPADLQRHETQPDASTRAVILAALVGALADAAKRPEFGGGREADEDLASTNPTHVAGVHMGRRLLSLDVDCKLPGDDDFDPAYAASLLVGDVLLAPEGDSSDE